MSYVYYEKLMLLTPDISPENYDAIKNKVEAIILENGGVIKNYDRWGKYLLAYPIKKYTYGIYVLLRFGIKQDVLNVVLNAIRALCALRFNLTMMRYVFVRLGKEISPVYCRPDSLEDAPRREKSYDIEEVISRKIKSNRNQSNFKKFDAAVLIQESDFFDEKITKKDSIAVSIEGTI